MRRRPAEAGSQAQPSNVKEHSEKQQKRNGPGTQSIPRVRTLQQLVRSRIAAIPTAAFSDFVWACLYDFLYSAYLNDLDAQRMALFMAGDLVLPAYLPVWMAIAFVIYRIVTNNATT